MTAAVAGAAPASGDGGEGTPQARRRGRGSTLLVAGGLVAAVAVAVLLTGDPRTSADLDPDNPDAGGAQALARVLADHGVEVTVARSAAELDEAELGDGTTVLVVRPDLLGTSAAERLTQDTRAAGSVVVAGAPPGATAALGIDDLPRQVFLGEGRDAGCSDPLVEGLTLEVDAAYAYPDDGSGCFSRDGAAVLLGPRPDLLLFGAPQAFTNDQVLRADNAAVALRLLGQGDRLVWYVPDPADVGADEGVSLSTLLPRWVRPALLLAVLVVLALMLWRGRRLGPLATEPLPVVVRAIETTRSRGRLYRKAGDRAHAAEALRSAARTRLAERLRLGAGVPLPVLLEALGRCSARSDAELAALLAPATVAPPNDRALIALANDLAALEEEVRRT